MLNNNNYIVILLCKLIAIKKEGDVLVYKYNYALLLYYLIKKALFLVFRY
jgi:hypothetical protein